MVEVTAEQVIEHLAFPLLVSLTNRVFDLIGNKINLGQAATIAKCEDRPVVSTVPTSSDAERVLIGREFTVSEYQPYAAVVGSLYLPYTVSYRMLGTEIPIVFIVEETQQQAILFEADLQRQFELYLSEGIYSFYILLVDGNADSLSTAEVYAIGFPSFLDLSGIGVEKLTLEEHNDIWELVNYSSPLEIRVGELYSLDFLLIDTDEISNSLTYFFETPEWELSPKEEEVYIPINPESFVICPVCDAEVKAKNIVRHLDKVHTPVNPEDFFVCPICDVEVKAKNMIRHFNRVHPAAFV